MGSKIKFDSYEVLHNPFSVTMVKKDKYSAFVLTYSGVSYFNWGSTIVGKEIELIWPVMSSGEFTILNGYYEDDAQKVLDLQDGTSKKYNVKIEVFEGKYFLGVKDESGTSRKDVRMTLLIMSEAI